MYTCKTRRYSCMNNPNEQYEKEKIEESCQNKCCQYNDYSNYCECGFDDEQNVFPDTPVLGQSYVPIQYIDKTFIPRIGLKMGTIYPELVNPYSPGQSMKEIAYLEASNEIGEGCNSCRKKIIHV